METPTRPATVTEDDVLRAMHTYGGRFVRALAVLYRQADYDNQRRLRTAFPEYWRDYADIAARHPARQGKPGGIGG